MDILTNTNRISINKENHHNSPSKELQKLKIDLNDRIFEIRKMEEDYAQQKAKLMIELQKEKQNNSKTIKDLKAKNITDN